MQGAELQFEYLHVQIQSDTTKSTKKSVFQHSPPFLAAKVFPLSQTHFMHSLSHLLFYFLLTIFTCKCILSHLSFLEVQ